MKLNQILYSIVLINLLFSAACSKSANEYVEDGKALYKEGKFPDAELKFKNAIQADARNAQAQYQLGLTLLKQKKKLDAYHAFVQAVAIDPGSMDAQKALLNSALDMYIADVRRPQLLFDQVQKASEELLKVNPRSVEGLKAAGYLALTGMKPVEASEYFLEARKQKAPDLMVVRGLISAYAQNGKLAEAEKAALAALEKDKTLGMLYDELYGIYMATNRPAEAQKMFEKKVVENPNVAAYRQQLAAHHANQKNMTAMEAALKPLHEDKKTFPEGRYECARFYMNLGRWEDAMKLLQEASGEDPAQRLKAKKSMVQCLAGMGKRNEAQQLAESLTKDFPDDAESRLARASFWIESRDTVKTQAAIADLEKVQAEFRGMPAYWLVLGRAYRQTGDVKKAMVAFQESAKMDGRSVEGQLAQAELSMLKGQPAQGMEAIEAALERSPNNSRARLLKAQAYLQTGKPKDAKVVLMDLAKEAPNFVEGQLQLGIVLESEKQIAEAEALYRKLLARIKGDPRVLEALARVYLSKGQGQQAIQMLEAELSSGKNTAGIENMLAQVAIDAKQPDTAMEHLTKLLERNPKNAQTHYLMAQAYLAKQDFNSAAAQLDQSIGLNPNDPVAVSVRGVVMQAMGRDDEALKSFRKALELRPNDTNMMNAVAFLQAEAGGNLDEALALVQKALLAAPNQSAYLDTLGWIYLKKGMSDQAVTVFEGLARKSGAGDPVLQYHLGAAKLKGGKTAEGKKHLEEALRLKPQKRDEERIRVLLG